AIAAAERALSLDPEHAPYHALLGGLVRNCGELNRAESAFRRAAELDPYDPHYTGLLINLLRQRGQTAQASAVVQEAIQPMPHAANLRLEFASLAAMAGDYATAEAAFREAAELEENPSSFAGLSGVLERQGRLDEAIQALERALSRSPDDPHLQGHLARLLG